MPETIEERVLRVIATTKRLPLEKVHAESTFEELGIDSLDRLNILFDLESEFDVEINDEEAKRVANIREMIVGIEQLVARKNEAAGKGEENSEELPETAAAPETPGE